MDEQRNQGQYGGHRNNRHNRFHRQGGHGGGGHQGMRPRGQRPLLTSSINAAGLCLVALAFMAQGMKERVDLIQFMGWAVTLFGLSAFVSYIAQRVRPSFVEKISDYLFLVGILLVIWVAIHLSGILTFLG